MAVLAHLYVNAHRKEGAPPISVEEFMYTDRETRRDELDAQMIAFLEGRADG
jgi:hypothetical protein